MKRAFVDDTRIIKLYAMFEWTHVFRNVWAIRHMFWSSWYVLSYDFQSNGQFRLFVTPTRNGAGFFINQVRLKFSGRSEFGRRKFLLQSLEGPICRLDVVPCDWFLWDSCEWLRDNINEGRDSITVWILLRHSPASGENPLSAGAGLHATDT